MIKSIGKYIKTKAFHAWIRIVYGRGTSPKRRAFLHGQQQALLHTQEKLSALETIHSEQTNLFTRIAKRQIQAGAQQFEETLTTNNSSHHAERQKWMEQLVSEKAQLLADCEKQIADLKKEHLEALDKVREEFNTKEATRAKEHSDMQASLSKGVNEVEDLKLKWLDRVKKAEATLHSIELTLQTISAKKADVLRRLAEIVALDPNVEGFHHEIREIRKQVLAQNHYEHQMINEAAHKARVLQ